MALSRLLSGFEEYPFTIQRICEILMVPGACYNKLDRLAWALEKCLMVTETVRPADQAAGSGEGALPSKRDLEREVGEMRRAAVSGGLGKRPADRGEGGTSRAAGRHHLGGGLQRGGERAAEAAAGFRVRVQGQGERGDYGGHLGDEGGSGAERQSD